MADCACRSRSQMASKPPRSTLSRVGLSSSGDPGPAHECPLIISSCRKTGWSSPRPCYQAPLHIPAQTCYVTRAATCPHLPNPGSTGLSASLLPPQALQQSCPQHSAHSNGPRSLCATLRTQGLKSATPSPPSVYWKVQWSSQQGGGWVSREPGHPVNERVGPQPRLLVRRQGAGGKSPHRASKSQPSALCRRHHKRPTPQV